MAHFAAVKSRMYRSACSQRRHASIIPGLLGVFSIVSIQTNILPDRARSCNWVFHSIALLPSSPTSHWSTMTESQPMQGVRHHFSQLEEQICFIRERRIGLTRLASDACNQSSSASMLARASRQRFDASQVGLSRLESL